VEHLLASATQTFGEKAVAVAMHEFLLWPEPADEISEEMIDRISPRSGSGFYSTGSTILSMPKWCFPDLRTEPWPNYMPKSAPANSIYRIRTSKSG
jgi:hypothetical protein